MRDFFKNKLGVSEERLQKVEKRICDKIDSVFAYPKCPKCGREVQGHTEYISQSEGWKDTAKTIAKYGAKIGTGLEIIPGGRLVSGLIQATTDGIIDSLSERTVYRCKCGYTWY